MVNDVINLVGGDIAKYEFLIYFIVAIVVSLMIDKLFSILSSIFRFIGGY